jgi:hypothetical protein
MSPCGTGSAACPTGSLPDNVTEDGEIVRAHAGQRAQIDKDQLRAEIARLRARLTTGSLRCSLAASHLLAGMRDGPRRGKAQNRVSQRRCPPAVDRSTAVASVAIGIMGEATRGLPGRLIAPAISTATRPLLSRSHSSART